MWRLPSAFSQTERGGCRVQSVCVENHTARMKLDVQTGSKMYLLVLSYAILRFHWCMVTELVAVCVSIGTYHKIPTIRPDFCRRRRPEKVAPHKRRLLPARPAVQGCHIIVLVEQSADFGCSATAGRVVDIAAASSHVDA